MHLGAGAHVWHILGSGPGFRVPCPGHIKGRPKGRRSRANSIHYCWFSRRRPLLFFLFDKRMKAGGRAVQRPNNREKTQIILICKLSFLVEWSKRITEGQVKANECLRGQTSRRMWMSMSMSTAMGMMARMRTSLSLGHFVFTLLIASGT